MSRAPEAGRVEKEVRRLHAIYFAALKLTTHAMPKRDEIAHRVTLYPAFEALARDSLAHREGRAGKRKPCECSTLRIALRNLAACPITSGLGAHYRDWHEKRGIPDPLRAARVLTGLRAKPRRRRAGGGK